MPTIHCLSGYIGFGKTTLAKQLAIQYNAKRITPDEIMIQLYGTDVQSDFMQKAEEVNQYVWQQIEECIQKGEDVIFDTGPWGIEDRKYIMNKDNNLNTTVIWHQIQCSLETAKKRTLVRAQQTGELSVDEKFFDDNLKRYVPITANENLQVVYHNGE